MSASKTSQEDAYNKTVETLKEYRSELERKEKLDITNFSISFPLESVIGVEMNLYYKMNMEEDDRLEVIKEKIDFLQYNELVSVKDLEVNTCGTEISFWLKGYPDLGRND